MRHPITFASERQAAISLLRLLSVAAIALPLLVLAGGSAIAWHNKQEDGWDSTSRLTDLIYESVSKLFAAQLLVLDEAQALTEGLDDDALRTHEADLHARLASMLKRLPPVRDVFVVGRAGRAIVDGVRFPSPSGDDLNDRDYVQYFRHGGEGLFVSVPALRKVDGRRFFALAIPRRLQDGAYSGVVATSVAPEFFEDYFRQAAQAYGEAGDRILALRRGDGEVLVRVAPERGGPMGDRRFMSMLSSSDAMAGRFEVTLADTGRHWLVTWRRMPEVNMIVLTALDRAAVVRDWASSSSRSCISACRSRWRCSSSRCWRCAAPTRSPPPKPRQQPRWCCANRPRKPSASPRRWRRSASSPGASRTISITCWRSSWAARSWRGAGRPTRWNGCSTTSSTPHSAHPA